MTQYARLETRTAWLGFEFGDSFARKIFGDEVLESALAKAPRYVRGKSKGKTKCTLLWVKCLEGGWVKGRGVENRVGSRVFAALVCPDVKENGGVLLMDGDENYSNVIPQWF